MWLYDLDQSMSNESAYEDQVEGATIILNSEETDYFQLLAATDDGHITLAGQLADSSFDAGKLLGQQIQTIAEQTDMSYREVAEYGVQEAENLGDVLLK
jgi:hypothetical protein